MDYKDYLLPEVQDKPKGNAHWRPPSGEEMKINIDGSFNPSSKSGGWGFAIRDAEGDFMGGAAGYIEQANSALQTEAVACMKALQAAQDWGMVRVEMETDAQLLVNAIKGDDQDLSLNGVLFREIKAFALLNFTSFSITFCPRACNKLADACATYGAKLDRQPQSVWLVDAPVFVRDIVASDKAVLSGY
jgi:ribonuclease HI